MHHHPDVIVRATENEEQSRFAVESESLFDKLTVLRRRLWDLRASIDQMERLYEEIKATKADVGSLQAEIDSLAERFDLQAGRAKED